METVISRDTDIIREYLAALDGRERGFSAFARFAATTKLAALRRELSALQIESTGEDAAELRREINERLNRTLLRRLIAKPWGGRLFVIGMLIVGQQLALAALLLLTALFIRFAPVPKLWNPVLPHEQPGFIYAFVFLFFFATPMLATLVAFGGRYFRSWKQTLPATALILALSLLATFFVFRGRESSNPARHSTSLEQLAKDRDANVSAYRQWTESVWLLRDPQFQHDYDGYLRNGPGRWITSRLVSGGDEAWQHRNDDSDSLRVIAAYLDSGQDQNGFREWLKYYLDRHRVYSAERIDQEVSAMTGSANQRYLGLWQMEPYLKERDERLYRAYLGSIVSAMKRWGLYWMALLTVVFLALCFAPAAFNLRAKFSGGFGKAGAIGVGSNPSVTQPLSQPHSFPERNQITSPPFFDAPFRLFAGIHRSFLKRAVLTSVFVFVFWAALYSFALSGEPFNPSSQIDLMRSNLLVAGWGRESSPAPLTKGRSSSVSYVTVGRAGIESQSVGASGAKQGVDQRIARLEGQFEEEDYQSSKRFKEQYQALAAQRAELGSVESLTSQLQQTTSDLPEKLSDIGSRATSAEARAGEVGNQAAAAQKAADQLSDKVKDVETRAARAADQVGRVESQVSVLATRTDAMDKEFERRASQIEARTEELGERTEGLKETGEHVERVQRIAFSAILSELTTATDDLDRRVTTSFYRFVNKNEARRDADALAQRIKSLTTELGELKTDQAAQWIADLDALSKRVADITARIK